MKETGRKMRERSAEKRGEDKEKIMKAGRRHNLVQIVNRMKERETMEECVLLFALTPRTGRWEGGCRSRREKCEVGEEEKKKVRGGGGKERERDPEGETGRNKQAGTGEEGGEEGGREGAAGKGSGQGGWGGGSGRV